MNFTGVRKSATATAVAEWRKRTTYDAHAKCHATSQSARNVSIRNGTNRPAWCAQAGSTVGLPRPVDGRKAFGM